MKLFVKFREKIGYKILNKRVSKLQRKKVFNNLSSAKTIGILFDASSQEIYNNSLKFVKQLSDKKIDVYAIGFVMTKDALTWYSSSIKINFFSFDQLNWYFEPKMKEVKEFCERKFDILIDVSFWEKLPLNFIFGQSKAYFKIATENQKNYADLTINVGDKIGIDYFSQQFQHYLTSISKE